MHFHHSNTLLSGLFDQNFSHFFARGQINWNYRIKLASISQKDGWSVKIFDEQTFERFLFALLLKKEKIIQSIGKYRQRVDYNCFPYCGSTIYQS